MNKFSCVLVIQLLIIAAIGSLGLMVVEESLVKELQSEKQYVFQLMKEIEISIIGGRKPVDNLKVSITYDIKDRKEKVIGEFEEEIVRDIEAFGVSTYRLNIPNEIDIENVDYESIKIEYQDIDSIYYTAICIISILILFIILLILKIEKIKSDILLTNSIPSSK